MSNEIPKNHPRYESLIQREKIKKAYKEGILADSGMIAHGRGETFDYLLGEKTTNPGKIAIKLGAQLILNKKNTVISINGNVAALVADEIIELAYLTDSKVEINLFYRTPNRVAIIESKLKKHELVKKGFVEVLGTNNEDLKYINGIESPRATASKNGIYNAELVLVALEDGDRCELLKKAGKFIIAIDLNPLSRTAQMADLSIIDNIVRAIPLLIKEVKNIKKKNNEEIINSREFGNINEVIDIEELNNNKENNKYKTNLDLKGFSNKKNLNDSLKIIRNF
ncbi:MAG: phosphopantothenate/pantothenate synthetase [Methanobacteriaceae archaeon]